MTMKSLLLAFDLAVQASWQAAVIAALVLAISVIFGRRIGPAWRCALWAIVFLRLLLPALPPSSMSLFNLHAPERASHADGDAAEQQITIGVLLGSPTSSGAPASAPAMPPHREISTHFANTLNWIEFAAMTWAAGATLLIARLFMSLVVLTRRVRRLPDSKDAKLQAIVEAESRSARIHCPRITESDRVASPALAGILRPTLLMPAGIGERLAPSELAAVVRHELAHIRRHDVLIGLLATVAACLHWFNPLAWLASSCFRAERELACDEIASTAMGDRADYGRTILKLLDVFPPAPPGRARQFASAIGMFGSRRSVRQRIRAISTPSVARWPLAGPALVLIVGCSTLSGPRHLATQSSAASPPRTALTTAAPGDDLNTITRVYDVRDVLIEVPSFDNAPALGLGAHLIPAASTAATKTGPPPATSDNPPPPRTRQQLIDDLVTRITSTIDPYSWQSNTGHIGSIRELNGQLIITQSPANHERIWQFLQSLRGQRSVQITVQAQFIQSPPVEKALQDLRPAEHAWSNIGGQAFDLWLGFLDEDQVQRLIQLTQSDQHSTIVTAPRLTLFNGQRAYVLVSRSTAYVSDLKPKTNGDFEPIIATADSGILFDCQANVTGPDHRNVTLALRPRETTLLDMTAVRWPAAPAGRDDLKVQIPHLRTAALDTTITMPDRKCAVYRIRRRYDPAPTTHPAIANDTVLMFIRPQVIVMPETDLTGTSKPLPLLSSKPAR